MTQPRKRLSRVVAFFLSLLFPALRQLHKRQLLNGIVWFIVVAVGYVALVIPGLILHVCCAIFGAMGKPHHEIGLRPRLAPGVAPA